MSRKKKLPPFETLTKSELIECLEYLNRKCEEQAKVISAFEKKLKKQDYKIRTYEQKLVKSLPPSLREKNLVRPYQDLIKDYQLEISDLKEEIESWKIRYISKGK